jgi:hypothetical protein
MKVSKLYKKIALCNINRYPNLILDLIYNFNLGFPSKQIKKVKLLPKLKMDRTLNNLLMHALNIPNI